MERCSWYISTDKTGGSPIVNCLTNVTSTSPFDGEHQRMKTPKRLINVEIQYHLDAFDIERLVEATRILMEVLGEEIDREGNARRSS
jgi:hypothetical protein